MTRLEQWLLEGPLADSMGGRDMLGPKLKALRAELSEVRAHGDLSEMRQRTELSKARTFLSMGVLVLNRGR